LIMGAWGMEIHQNDSAGDLVAEYYHDGFQAAYDMVKGSIEHDVSDGYFDNFTCCGAACLGDIVAVCHGHPSTKMENRASYDLSTHKDQVLAHPDLPTQVLEWITLSHQNPKTSESYQLWEETRSDDPAHKPDNFDQFRASVVDLCERLIKAGATPPRVGFWKTWTDAAPASAAQPAPAPAVEKAPSFFEKYRTPILVFFVLYIAVRWVGPAILGSGGPTPGTAEETRHLIDQGAMAIQIQVDLTDPEMPIEVTTVAANQLDAFEILNNGPTPEQQTAMMQEIERLIAPCADLSGIAQKACVAQIDFTLPPLN
ncbi:MAG: DUF4259 domain-containing protein, partial [Pseudomonadota bacterium]